MYTIHGSEKGLRPILFSAHQDVVPVQNSTTWTFPPFKAYYDGQYLWGRGSCDCKNNLIGIFSAVEELLSHDDWMPKRTIVLAFGFDEEIGGSYGAAHIAVELEKRWGKQGIEFILDEGGMGLVTKDDAIYALPAVHEKSYLDIYLDLDMDGGHSSKPPPHSAIGVISEIVVALEANPYHPVLVEGSPYYQHLVCQAKYSPAADPWLADALQSDRLEYVAEQIATQSPEIRFRMQTSQAVDIVQGGGKINALPEQVSLGINYRIAPQDSIDIVQKNVLSNIEPIITKYGLSVITSWEDDDDSPSPQRASTKAAPDSEPFVYHGTLRLRPGESTPQTPISPTQNNAVWNEFSATVQHVYSRYAKRVVPVGDIMNGNTDTRHYWKLSDNIYRWSPSRLGTRVNVHTIDERLDMSAHIDGLRLYYGKLSFPFIFLLQFCPRELAGALLIDYFAYRSDPQLRQLEWDRSCNLSRRHLVANGLGECKPHGNSFAPRPFC